MRLKFIGEDRSMGLRTNRVYRVEVRTSYNSIWVCIGNGWKCPYSSPQSFAANWTSV